MTMRSGSSASCIAAPLAQEFRIGRQVEALLAALALQGGPDTVRRPRRDGRLLDHDRTVRSVARDLTGGLLHREEVRIAVGASGCADADEHDLGVTESVGGDRAEGQSSRG